MLCNRRLKLSISAFYGSGVRKRCNLIVGAITDVMGGGLNPTKPRLVEQPSQATTCIRFGNALRTPKLLADVVEALRVGRLRASKDDTTVLHRRCTDDAAAPDDTPQLNRDTRL